MKTCMSLIVLNFVTATLSRLGEPLATLTRLYIPQVQLNNLRIGTASAL